MFALPFMLLRMYLFHFYSMVSLCKSWWQMAHGMCVRILVSCSTIGLQAITVCVISTLQGAVFDHTVMGTRFSICFPCFPSKTAEMMKHQYQTVSDCTILYQCVLSDPPLLPLADFPSKLLGSAAVLSQVHSNHSEKFITALG